MRRRNRSGALVIAGLTLVGCQAPTQAADAAGLEGSTWRLVSMPGSAAPIAQDGAAADGGATARFEAGRIAGSDGCNRYSGTYAATAATIEVGPDLVATRMACPPEVMARADAFTAALVSARRFRIDGDRLELRSDANDLLMTLALDADRDARRAAGE